MNKIWWAVLVLVGYVSLYPFNFAPRALDSQALYAFLSTCCTLTSRGDILGNFILFIPVGFAGLLAPNHDTVRGGQVIRVVVTATVFALLLQLLQLFLSSRDESLQDVLWNFLGTIAGVTIAATVAGRVPRLGSLGPVAAIPTALLVAWFSYRLIPFVPSVDLQLIKDSLKPLLKFDIRPDRVAHDLTAWALTGYLMRQLRPVSRLDRYLPHVIVITLGLEILIINNAVSGSNVVGALLGASVWIVLLSRLDRPEITLAIFLTLVIVVGGLYPFSLRAQPTTFNWLPFSGFLGGSMYANAQSAASKLFLYGALVLLLRQTKRGYSHYVLAAALLIGVIELLQTRLYGHTPEITDPVLVLLAALAIKASTTAERSARSDYGNPGETAGTPYSRIHVLWLPDDQLRFLRDLGQELGLSPEQTASRIIEEAVMAQDNRIGSTSLDTEMSGSGTSKPIRVELTERTRECLLNSAQQYDLPLPKLLSQLISDFIGSLSNPIRSDR